ncbi:enolase C-terminal domain-like protein [Halomontanus rarus]|uniref:enolase C-terminal domain-like protein n=1 Tax=Halomontanus rarus TaxID=3034020 RepID=UPI001A999BD4
MHIVDVDVEIVTVGRNFGTTSAVKETEESVFGYLRLTADDGTTGVGEISDIEDPESMPAAAVVEEEVGSFLEGADPRAVNKLTRRMDGEVRLGEFDFHSFQQLTLAAIDHALYDLVGNYYDVPSYQLLGGRTRDVTLSWVVYTRQEPDAIDALREEVQTRFDQGFDAFKLKVGEVDPHVDHERIEAVREIVGDEAQVFVDAQGVWELEEAIENVRLFEEAGIDGIETPVGHPDRSVDAPGSYYDIPLLPSELATVREETNTPVFEHVLDPEFGLALAAEDAVDVFTVEACAGGLNRAQRILAIADGAGIDARLGSTGELGVGTLAAAALGASSPAITYPCDLAGPMIYDDDVLEAGIEYRDGLLRPPDTPGLGFDLRTALFESPRSERR